MRKWLLALLIATVCVAPAVADAADTEMAATPNERVATNP